MDSNSVIPEGFQLEGDSNIPEGFVLEGTPGAPIDRPENFLQRAIKEAGLTSMNVLGNVTGIKQGYDYMRTVPMAGLMEQGVKIADKSHKFSESFPKIPEPESKLGKTISNVAGYIPIGVGVARGGIGAIKGISGLLKKPTLIREAISDVARLGSEEVSNYVGRLHNVFINKFDKGLKKLTGFVHSDKIADALETTATKLGATNVAESSGSKVMQMANEYRELGKTGRMFNPQEVQALIGSKGVIPSSFGKDMAARVGFYDEMSNILKDQLPELKELRKGYSQFYDIKNASKLLKSGNLQRASGVSGSGKQAIMGSEEFGKLGEAEQMLQYSSKAPKPLQEVSQLGERFQKAKLGADITKTGIIGGVLGTPYGIWELFKKRID